MDALAELIDDGLAKACLWSRTGSCTELQGMPPLDVVEKGMDPSDDT